MAKLQIKLTRRGGLRDRRLSFVPTPRALRNDRGRCRLRHGLSISAVGELLGLPRISHSAVRGAGINEDLKDVALSSVSQATSDRQGFELFRADEIDHYDSCQRDGYRVSAGPGIRTALPTARTGWPRPRPEPPEFVIVSTGLGMSRHGRPGSAWRWI